MADLDFAIDSAAEDGGGTRLTLSGELDLGSAPRLESALATAAPPIVLDLRGLKFMDSTGVRVLLEAAERGGIEIIAPATGDARQTIDETGIGPLLPLVDPPEEAP
jgi:anti-sigma B factor antagonist